jgi:hypothetical protein
LIGADENSEDVMPADVFTPATMPSSLTPVPSIPIEKPAVLESPSPSVTLATKSSFWSGVGCG